MVKCYAAISLVAIAVDSPLAAQEWNRVNVDRTPEVIGNGHVVTQQRAVADFRSVNMHGEGDMIVRVGARPSLTVTADSNILPLLGQRQRGDQLTLEPLRSYRSRTRPRFVLTVRDLRSVGIGGSGNARVEGVSSDHLALAVGGSGKIVASGRTGRVALTIGGSGEIDTRALRASSVAVTIGGSGSARVATEGALSGTIAGSGSIRYLGRPSAIAVTRIGSGTVAPLR